jgi:hypothetical protein
VLQWEHLPFPKSLPQFQKLFPDDAACARWLEGAKCGIPALIDCVAIARTQSRPDLFCASGTR